MAIIYDNDNDNDNNNDNDNVYILHNQQRTLCIQR